MSGQNRVREAVAGLSYVELEGLARVLARAGDRADQKRLIAVLSGWAGWQPPRPAKVNPFAAAGRAA